MFASVPLPRPTELRVDEISDRIAAQRLQPRMLSVLAELSAADREPGTAVAACVPAAIGKGSMPGFRGCPQRVELIFAASTYKLIGEYDVVTPGSPAVAFLPDYALLQAAIVNKLGELP